MKLPSYTITQGKDRAPARAFLKAIGLTDEDIKKPIIGIANTWIGTMPCNFKLRDLAVNVADGIRKAGGTPMEYNTIAISDGITMGTEGMKASLVSRDLIADSIELVARGHMFDGIVALVAFLASIIGIAFGLGMASSATISWASAMKMSEVQRRPSGADADTVPTTRPTSRSFRLDVVRSASLMAYASSWPSPTRDPARSVRAMTYTVFEHAVQSSSMEIRMSSQ